jgi:chaperonin GroES
VVQLLGDRVLVKPDLVAPPTTESGIQIAEAYHYAPEVSGIVIALGDGPRAEDGTLLPHVVNVGDRVVFAAESGHELVVEGNRQIVLREDDLLATIA